MCYHIPQVSCAFLLAGIEGGGDSDQPIFFPLLDCFKFMSCAASLENSKACRNQGWRTHSTPFAIILMSVAVHFLIVKP